MTTQPNYHRDAAATHGDSDVGRELQELQQQQKGSSLRNWCTPCPKHVLFRGYKNTDDEKCCDVFGRSSIGMGHLMGYSRSCEESELSVLIISTTVSPESPADDDGLGPAIYDAWIQGHKSIQCSIRNHNEFRTTAMQLQIKRRKSSATKEHQKKGDDEEDETSGTGQIE